MPSGFTSIFSREDTIEHPGQLTRAAAFLGLQVNYLLWGVQIAQSYYYYKSYRKTDGLWLKVSVGLLFVTEALQSVFTSVFCWRSLVEGLSQLPHQSMAWGGNDIPFLDALTASIVHFNYAYMIWKLLHSPYNNICAAFVITLSCLQLAAGLGSTVFMSIINITMAELFRIKTWIVIWLVTAVVNDLVITALMGWRLSASRTGIKKTDDIVSKLVRLFVETGFATAIVQIICIILYVRWPLKSYNFVPALLGPKVYSNSMLALLNSRKARKPGDTCNSCNAKPIDNIVIHTTRTIDVSSDDQLRGYTLDSGNAISKLDDGSKDGRV